MTLKTITVRLVYLGNLYANTVKTGVRADKHKANGHSHFRPGFYEKQDACNGAGNHSDTERWFILSASISNRPPFQIN